MSTATAPARIGTVLADLLPSTRARTGDLVLVAGGAVLTGLAAQIAVPVPGSPVPVSGQTFAALLVGTALGARRGFLSLALYVLAGMAGVPWFAQGTAGYAMPTLGYVLGMLLAAAAVGALARRGGDRSVPRMAGTMAAGSLVVYAVGVPYLALATGMPPSRAVAVGMVPFLVGDALKAALAMGLVPTVWRLLGDRDRDRA
uniref:biotin transporter BioY n=1 Tax=Streptomyces sp. MRC013 TaxID=2898276 RepID=UPI0020272058|nr:biotin transporter BioY [Streptomyces sp. MRC013]URM91376.1 biotin transporter BioY [Streptomyces sp. MRC013]